MAFKKGDPVTEVLPPPVTGTIDGFIADNETGDIQILVVWNDEDGTQHSRYFLANELKPA